MLAKALLRIILYSRTRKPDMNEKTKFVRKFGQLARKIGAVLKLMKLTKARALVSEYDMNKNESAVVGRNLQ